MTQKKPKRVMVLLVGGRLTPNFIGVLGYQPDFIECIVSNDERKKYSDVLEVLSPLPAKLSTTPYFVDAFDVQQSLEICRQIVSTHSEAEIIFNVTCATKVMGIAAYEVAKQAGYSAIYVDTTHGRFLDLTRPGEEPIPIQVSLRDYLGCYGRCPHKTFDFAGSSVPEDKAIAAASYLVEIGQVASDVLAWLRQYSRGKGRRTARARCGQPLEASLWNALDELCKVGLISNLQQRSETEVSYLIANDADWNFLDGTWLEVYVWNQARKCQDNSGHSLFYELDFSFEIPGEGGAKKEIDVGCMYQGQLIHCSCKSERNPFKTRYLDELRAVSSLLGGRFCSRLFITNVFPPREGSSEWRDFDLFLQQARDREIVVITGEELPNIGAILKREAEKPTFWRV